MRRSAGSRAPSPVTPRRWSPTVRPNSKTRWRRLLLALVEIDDVKGAVAARVAARASLADPRQRALADRLVAARLAVADDSVSGGALRLAHEALLTRWPTLAGLIAEHRDFLAARRRLIATRRTGSAAAATTIFSCRRAAGSPRRRSSIARRRAELDPESIAYAEASSEKARAAAEAAQRAKEAALRRELARSRRVAAVVSLLLLAAIGAGGYAWRLRGVAATALGEVEVEYQAALNQAAGSVSLFVDGADSGALSTDLMRRLVEQARDTVTGLPGQSDAATAAQVKLLDALSVAYLSLSGVDAARRDGGQSERARRSAVAKDPSSAAWTLLWLDARGRRADAEKRGGRFRRRAR